jgi:hypothetical protein
MSPPPAFRIAKVGMMVAKFAVRHELNTSAQGFWSDIFESEDFNDALYRDHLKCRYELEIWDPASGRRRARVWPVDTLPKPLASILGDSVSFVEDGTRNYVDDRYDFVVIPSKLAKRIDFKGTITARDLALGRCERTIAFEIEARVFGIGRAIEAALERTTREQYDDNAAFINEYLAANANAEASSRSDDG